MALLEVQCVFDATEWSAFKVSHSDVPPVAVKVRGRGPVCHVPADATPGSANIAAQTATSAINVFFISAFRLGRAERDVCPSLRPGFLGRHETSGCPFLAPLGVAAAQENAQQVLPMCTVFRFSGQGFTSKCPCKFVRCRGGALADLRLRGCAKKGGTL